MDLDTPEGLLSHLPYWAVDPVTRRLCCTSEWLYTLTCYGSTYSSPFTGHFTRLWALEGRDRRLLRTHPGAWHRAHGSS